MSASTERKNRLAAREAGTDKKMLAAQEAEKKARVSKRRWTIGTIAVVLCIALVLLLGSPLKYRCTTAETIGSKNYSPADVNYCSATTKASINYNLYAAYVGQEYADQLLAENLEKSMIQTTALLGYAEGQGLALSAQEKAAVTESVDSQLKQIKEAARANGASFDQYMNYVFGPGVNRAVMESGLRDSVLANKAYFSRFLELNYTQEELDAYNASLDANGDLISFAFYKVTAGEDRSADEAKAIADALKAGFADGYDGSADALTFFNDLLSEEIPGAGATVRSSVQAGTLDAGYHDWLVDDARQAGDFEILPGEDGAWFAVLFQERSDNTETVAQVRHILIKAAADEDGNYTDEAKADAKARAEKILAEWEAGDRSELSFASLAFLYSEDSGSNTAGGLYSGVQKGQMVEEFDRFCFEDHQYGDVAIVYGESGSYAGWHIMFYVGTDSARNASARDALRDEALSSWITGMTEDLKPETRWAYKLVG